MKKITSPFAPLHLTRGSNAEKQAKEYLIDQGLTFRTSNFRCKAGEIDLIMQDGDTLVFVEVRYRSNPYFGSAAESITASKIRKIRKTAEYFLLRYKQLTHLYMRFDVIAISVNTSQTSQTEKSREELLWIKDAF